MAGCTQSSSVGPPTTLTSLGARNETTTSSTTTTVLSPQTSVVNVDGYVDNVPDGRTFDLSIGKSDAKRGLVVAYIQVPPMGTCEGTEARNLLASLIFGKPVSIDSAGMTFLGDLDVGLTMIQYGRATPTADAPGYYIENAKLATPLNCANTTTTTLMVTIINEPAPTRPRTTPATATTVARPKTKPKTTTPKTQPDPVIATDPPVETTPAQTRPAPTEPAPTEPAPTEPAPTEPAQTDPAPAQTDLRTEHVPKDSKRGKPPKDSKPAPPPGG